jgi:hypothetical protein
MPFTFKGSSKYFICPNSKFKKYAGPVFSNSYSVDFDGTNDYALVSNNSTLTFGDGSNDSAFSISAWIKTDNFSGFRILTKNEWNATTDYREYIFSAANGLLLMGLVDAAGAVGAYNNYRYRRSSSVLSTGAWHHVVGTYDGRGGTNAHEGIKLYVDNVLETNYTAITAGTYVAMHDNTGSHGDIAIGAWRNSSFTNGKIDEVAVYSAELTSTQVSNIYNFGTPTDLSSDANLVGYWRFEENTGASIADSSTNSNTATLNGPTFSTDVPPFNYYSLNLDASSSHYINGDNFNANTMIGAGDMTVSMWVKLDTTTQYDTFMYVGASSSSVEYLQFRLIDVGGSLKLDLRGRAGSSGSASCTGTTTVTTGTWYNLVFTRTGTTAKVYINGSLEQTATDSDFGADFGSSADTTTLIGAFSGAANFMDGLIDEISIWEIALTSTQVSNIYNSGTPTDLSSDDYLVGYWRFTDNTVSGSGGSVADISTKSNTLTLKNGPTFSTDVP